MDLKPRCWQSCIPAGGSKGKSVLPLFLDPRDQLNSVAHGASSIFKANGVASSDLSLSLPLLPYIASSDSDPAGL